MQRLRITLTGAVQGVGFRPFVYRLATGLRLGGWVLNSSAGLTVEVEGDPVSLDEFVARLHREKPAPAVILTSESSRLAPAGFDHFEIRSSDEAEEKTVAVLPDLATCDACQQELFDPSNRRYQYPFINCTYCGPRYSIVENVPYDRPRTTMKIFTLCHNCRREYKDPSDRRFHAQPNACPVCGPRLSISIAEAAHVLLDGRVLALKGIGGFQLLVDARNEEAVVRLRRLKAREEKPFALMMPSLEVARKFCVVSEGERALLESSAAPIVLLTPNGVPGIAPSVARSSPYIGVMLPYSPLHHLLMREAAIPVVATSGNRSDEPIAIDNDEARRRLDGIADVFLMHDRPIARACDDSVVRLARGREMVLRRARGYAPMPVRVGRPVEPVLAVGAHLKNSVAIAIAQQVYLSQHIGDLDALEAREAFERAIRDLCRLYRFEPRLVACDMHPDYASTQWARSSGLRVVEVQHHEAHAASCAAENDVRGDYLGVSWDGTGYGRDATIWGGEFFHVREGAFERIAHLRTFRLPGGEAAVKEGWRSAASLLYEIEGARALAEMPAIARMLERGLNAPVTSSVGRLFDAVASISGVARESRFEGQAAMLLERAIGALDTRDAYPLAGGDWAELVDAVCRDARAGVAPGLISARFHNALAGWIVATAVACGSGQVVLSGGCFQNRYLVDRAVEALEARGFTVFTHQRVPPNDGGIALGQAVLAGSLAG
jgi:hydrogenase maturation protein HypF